ncbi:eukaryotic translation initiation factor 3 subunit A-like [Rosa chinensis]|uniref:eukaryotic translation initiation factor 3 subunit A-like n=1 Tax=Rosa chinensis TaxID=74649 RepID=UPI001AD9069B|nr:eukaryotic translation initiation factor 3 subunit A-like [Rosa chinensis]
MARLANAFDLLGEESSDVRRMIAIVDAKADAGFLAAEKERKEEAKEAERKKEEERQQGKKKNIRDTLLNSVLAFPTHRPSSSRRRPNFPREYNNEQNQGQGVHAPVVKKKWVPKSELESKSENGAAKAAASPSSSNKIQGTQKEEVKNQVQSHQGYYQQRRGRGFGHGAYQNRGTRTGSYSEHSDKKNVLELEKERETQGCDAAVEKQQTKEAVDGDKQSKEEGVNNDGDGGSSSKSVDGKKRQNKNGSLRRKLRKQKAAAGGEKKDGEDTNQEGDTSSVQNQSTPRLYTLKEYEEMKTRESLNEKKEGESLEEKKDNDINSAHPKRVTVDVNKEFRTPQVGERQRGLENGGRRFNNEGRRFTNGGQRFNNGGPRFNNEGRRFDNGGQRSNNEGRRFDNGGQRSNNGGRRLQYSLDNADEFPSLGRK